MNRAAGAGGRSESKRQRELLFRPHRIPAHRRGCGIRPYASAKVVIAQVAAEGGSSKIIRSNRAFKPNAGKSGTTVKSIIPNAGNAVRYGYAGKAEAIDKSIIPNAGNAVRYGNAGKAAATVKSIIPNAGNAVGNNNGFQELPKIDC